MREKRQRARLNAASERVPEIPGYEDLRPIGRGGFAVVYRARSTAFDRDVAIKVLSRQRLDDRTRRRFERERRTMGALSAHPNIVTIFDAGLIRGAVPYLVMQYLPRGSLADHLAGRGPLPWQDALATGIKLAGALEAAHRSGVLHRDVKPENVMVSAYGEPELGDFGIARVSDLGDTRSTEVNLSVPYAAPEIIAGDPYTERSDVYSLAATVYALVAGQAPFHVPGEDSMIPMLMRISTEPVPDLRGHGVPPAVATMLEQALEKSPLDRHASAFALGEALQDAERALGRQVTPMPVALPDDPVPTTTVRTPTAIVPTPTEPPPAAAARRRISLAIPGVVAVVAVVVLAILVVTRDTPDGERPAAVERATTTTARPTTSTPTTAPAALLAFPSDTRPLPPGTYRTSQLRVPLRFTVPAGWRPLGPEQPEILDLSPNGSSAEVVSFLVVDTVLDPARTFTRKADQRQAGAQQPVPSEGLVQWFLDHPRLEVGTPAPARVGALAGVRFDVQVSDGYAYGTGCPACVLLFPFGDGYALSAATTNRVFVTETERGWLVIAVEADPARFAAFSDAADTVLGTVARD